MRKPRDNQPNRVYHIISRIAHRAFFLNDEERDRFVDLLRRAADFSGVDLLSWCVMTNHVHVLVFVGERREIPDEEILRRMQVLYRPARFDELRREWDRLAAHPKSASFRRFRESFLKRMWNASAFMQTLKQHFTMSFNERREHTGTMWEGRCHMRVHRPDAFGMGGEAMLTAGYIDANPVKAGIVPSIEQAGDYPWGSFHAACSGDAGAIRGYDMLYGSHGYDWATLREKQLRSMREAARELAAREAEERGLGKRGVGALRQEKRERTRRARLEEQLPKAVPHLAETGCDAVAFKALKLLGQGPLRPAALRETLGIASRPYFTLRYLSPLVRAGYVRRQDAGGGSSCKATYCLTRKGREAVECPELYHIDRITRV